MGKSDRGWGDDRLVPISSERLRAAIVERGISVARLARRVGMKQPALHYVVLGKTKRCRASNRAALASVFKIQEAWLAGEQDAGPFRTRHLRFAGEHGTTVESAEIPLHSPPVVQLRAARLIEQCLARWEGDLTSGRAPAPDARSILGKVRANYTGKFLTLWLGDYFEGLLLGVSRLRLYLYTLPTVFGPQDGRLFAWLWGHDDQLTLSLIGALERLLAPWLTGERQLNYQACYTFLEQFAKDQNEVFRGADMDMVVRYVKNAERG